MQRIVVVVIGALVAIACSRAGSSRTSKAANVSAWGTVDIGSVFESRTVTRMQAPFVHQTETTTRQTLIARSDSEAAIKIELSEGSASSARNATIPLRQDDTPPHDGSTVTTAEETCTVPAGTFDCTRTTVEMRQGPATRSTETWTAKTIPVPIKSVVRNENMTVTTELMRLSVAP